MPIWLASKIEGHVNPRGREATAPWSAAWARAWRRRIRLKDLAAAGKGLIADVEDDDGQVLVWLR